MNNNKFFIDTTKEDTICILHLNGFLDALTSVVLEEEIKKNVENNCFKIVLDLKSLTYISSAGLGVFMLYIEKIRKNEGDIIMTNLSKSIFEVMNLLGFDEIFHITNTVEEAISLFNNS